MKSDTTLPRPECPYGCGSSFVHYSGTGKTAVCRRCNLRFGAPSLTKVEDMQRMHGKDIGQAALDGDQLAVDIITASQAYRAHPSISILSELFDSLEEWVRSKKVANGPSCEHLVARYCEATGELCPHLHTSVVVQHGELCSRALQYLEGER